jgi:hypothetical protein
MSRRHLEVHGQLMQGTIGSESFHAVPLVPFGPGVTLGSLGAEACQGGRSSQGLGIKHDPQVMPQPSRPVDARPEVPRCGVSRHASGRQARAHCTGHRAHGVSNVLASTLFERLIHRKADRRLTGDVRRTAGQRDPIVNRRYARLRGS